MNPTKIYITDPKGTIHHVLNVPMFAMAHNMDVTKLRELINGRVSEYRRWVLTEDAND